ncbi:nacht and ankyrin domain protein [Colletotrichum karsti]|uniref:Nacht and ankyrin domain protein n=1 Tax=Colletotrichum karsti TaxID=1095194 RepID=A0A9P6LN89_9PEZI|nr:nacht and ankyrin domain protein [Colletotrichum karsti]KAF9878956.1 nacht and ankyrin domain protein [Colletotrichum karsti]
MEEANIERRHNASLPKEWERPCQAVADLPPLPPILPRPEYALKPYVISHADSVVHFLAACEEGLLEEVSAFIQRQKPSQAILQYGLEHASFENQVAVVRYLLDLGAKLHGNVFVRPESQPCTRRQPVYADVCIFDPGREDKGDLLPLVKVLTEFGWHPNQAWKLTLYNVAKIALPYRGCLMNKPLSKFLLEHGADPNIDGGHLVKNGSPTLQRETGELLNAAFGLWDMELVDMLLAHGANLSYARPLHSLVSGQVKQLRNLDIWNVPFSRRRPLAEHVLELGLMGVNDVKMVPYTDMICRQRGSTYETTAFAYACAAQDYEYAEWLLERGANPELAGGKAFTQQWFFWSGPTNPETVREMVKKVKERSSNGAGRSKRSYGDFERDNLDES